MSKFIPFTCERLHCQSISDELQRVFHFASDFKYKSSTFFLAHGVCRKNFKLDLMLGFSIKHLMRMRLPNSAQPYCSTRRLRTISSVIPYRGSFDCCSGIATPSKCPALPAFHFCFCIIFRKKYVNNIKRFFQRGRINVPLGKAVKCIGKV